MSFGSVMARKMRSRGASNKWVTVKSCLPGSTVSVVFPTTTCFCSFACADMVLLLLTSKVAVLLILCLQQPLERPVALVVLARQAPRPLLQLPHRVLVERIQVLLGALFHA